MLYLFAWIATIAGRKLLGGTGSHADVRAAMAWGLVPVIWSPVYRIPFALYAHRFQAVATSVRPEKLLFDFLSTGGCSLLVVYMAVQLLFTIWCFWVGSHGVAEAQQFSPAKGFANIAIALAAPLIIIAAAIAANQFHLPS